MIALALAAALLASAPSAKQASSVESRRSIAQGALSTARTALVQSGVPTDEVRRRLADAEKLFASGRYDDAAKAADAAWREHAKEHPQDSAFEVTVAEDGTTVVRHKRGKAVRVEGGDERVTVSTGEVARIETGRAPAVRSTLPPVPRLVSPRDASKVELLGDPAALGPVVLRWAQVSGAKIYEVELASEDGQRRTVKVETAEAVFDRLPAGKYVWKVHAVGEEGRSASPERTFQLAQRAIKLKVTGGTSFE